jgi:hypothetical protein
MANPFYSWQKLLARVGLGRKDLIRGAGKDDFENLATMNFQILGHQFWDLFGLVFNCLFLVK